jgi:hypothetical protein
VDIDLQTLEAATGRLFSHLKETGHESIHLSSDYYWSIPAVALYNPYHQPTELTLGQLSSDMAEIKAIATGEKAPLGFACVWLAAVFRAVGENTVS